MACVRRTLAVCLIIVSVGAAARGDESLPPLTLKFLKNATVFVKTEIGPLPFSGSGFVIQVTDDTALIATNHHVITRPKQLQVGGFIPGLNKHDKAALLKLQLSLAKFETVVSVVFNSGEADEQVIKAEIMGGTEDPDLAILKVKGIKTPPKPITFRKQAQLMETMPVYMLGFPFGEMLQEKNKGNPAITVGKGAISSFRKDAKGRMQKIQIDGALNPGNSGGPVVDSKGNLVGVAVQTIQGSNIGLAVPSTELVGAMDGRVGEISVVAVRGDNGPAPKYEAIVELIDPLKKLKSAALQYVDGPVEHDPAKAGQSQLPATNQKIDLPLTDLRARVTLLLPASAGPKAREVTVQASYVNEQGKPIYLDPVVVKVEPPTGAAPGPAVVESNRPATGSVTRTSPDGTVSDLTRGNGVASKRTPVLPDDVSSLAPEEEGDVGKTDWRSRALKAAGKGPDLTWNNVIAKMKKIPNDEVMGSIDGIDFYVDRVTLVQSRLVFTMAPGFRRTVPEAELALIMPINPNADLSGKKFSMNGRQRGMPTIRLISLREQDKQAKSQTYSEYWMTLEFGNYDSKQRIQPGKIYICLPDRAKSFLVGSFDAKVK